MEAQGAQTHHLKNSSESENNNNKNNYNNYHNNNNNYRRNLMVKTELCRRFKKGVCTHGVKCDYAHSVSELRRQPKLCRLFLQTKHCSYGRTCRFLHSATPQPPPSTFPIPNPQFQPEIGKLDRFSSAEYKRMPTYAVAPSDSYPSAENRTMQSSAAAATTNVSTNTLETNSSHKNDPYAVKFIFKKNELKRIDGIYADWISDSPR